MPLDDHAGLVSPRASPPPPDRLRVATWNVEYKTTADRLIDALRSHAELAKADVLLLQEIGPDAQGGPDRAARIAAAFDMGFAYAHGLAIVCRWPLVDAALMQLPRAHLPYNRRTRVALAASIETTRGPLRLVTVHLDTRLNAAERVAQLAPAVADPRPLQILGGDMNTLPFRFAAGAVPIWGADQRGPLDAHLRGLGFDAAAADRPTHRARMRLDALYTRGFAPCRARVATEVPVSDHYPLWADLAPACQ